MFPLTSQRTNFVPTKSILSFSPYPSVIPFFPFFPCSHLLMSLTLHSLQGLLTSFWQQVTQFSGIESPMSATLKTCKKG